MPRLAERDKYLVSFSRDARRIAGMSSCKVVITVFRTKLNLEVVWHINKFPHILNFMNAFIGPQVASCEQADGTIFTGPRRGSEWVRKEYVSELHKISTVILLFMSEIRLATDCPAKFVAVFFNISRQSKWHRKIPRHLSSYAKYRTNTLHIPVHDTESALAVRNVNSHDGEHEEFCLLGCVVWLEVTDIWKESPPKLFLFPTVL